MLKLNNLRQMMTAMSSLCMHTATNFSSSLWFQPKRKSGIGHLDGRDH